MLAKLGRLLRVVRIAERDPDPERCRAEGKQRTGTWGFCETGIGGCLPDLTDSVHSKWGIHLAPPMTPCLSERSNHISKADQYSPHIIGTAGNEIWSKGEFSQTIQSQNGAPIQLKGYWGSVTVREGDTWKTRMVTFNIAPAPAATPSPTATPSNQ